jgi:hypothetical protein
VKIVANNFNSLRFSIKANVGDKGFQSIVHRDNFVVKPNQ